MQFVRSQSVNIAVSPTGITWLILIGVGKVNRETYKLHFTKLEKWGSSVEPVVNLLKPTGHVMHHQFNIQQLYALPTLYLCVLYLSEDKQRLVPLTA